MGLICLFSRPFGTQMFIVAQSPKVETLGYFQESLRDTNQNPDDIGSSTRGAKVAECRHNPVPEGHATIAQRFNVGVGVTCGESPEGTADGFDMLFQSSLRDSMFVVTKSPKVKTLGLFSRIPPGSKPIFNNPSGIKIKTSGIKPGTLRNACAVPT